MLDEVEVQQLTSKEHSMPRDLPSGGDANIQDTVMTFGEVEVQQLTSEEHSMLCDFPFGGDANILTPDGLHA